MGTLASESTRQMIGVQQPDGQIVMVLANGNSPIKTSQPRLINLSESNLIQVQETVKPLKKYDKILLYIGSAIEMKSNGSEECIMKI